MFPGPVSHTGMDISNPKKSAEDNLTPASDDTATDNSLDDNATENSLDDNGGDSASRVSQANHDLCEHLGATESTDDSGNDSATPSQSLDDAAAAAGMTVTEFCASVANDSSNGVGDDNGADNGAGNEVGGDNGAVIGGHGADDAVPSGSIEDSGKAGVKGGGADDTTQSTVAPVTVPGQATVPSTSIVDKSGINSGGVNGSKNKNGTSGDSRG